MLKLNDGLFWLTILPGVRVQLAPVTPAAFILAREQARRVFQEGDDDAQVNAQVAFTHYLASRGIVAWEGVGDADGEPVPPTRDEGIKDASGEVVEVRKGTITLLLENYSAYESIDRLYVGPVLDQEAEKNASSPSRTGPSATATPIAEGAGKAARRRAKPAPSPSTSPEPTPAS